MGSTWQSISQAGSPLGSKASSPPVSPLLQATQRSETQSEQPSEEAWEEEHHHELPQSREPGSPTAWPDDKAASTWPGISPSSCRWPGLYIAPPKAKFQGVGVKGVPYNLDKDCPWPAQPMPPVSGLVRIPPYTQPRRLSGIFDRCQEAGCNQNGHLCTMRPSNRVAVAGAFAMLVDEERRKKGRRRRKGRRDAVARVIFPHTQQVEYTKSGFGSPDAFTRQTREDCITASHYMPWWKTGHHCGNQGCRLCPKKVRLASMTQNQAEAYLNT